MKNLKQHSASNVTFGHLATAIPAEEVNLWPSNSKEAALQMIEKFGLPDSVSAEALIWNRDGATVIVDKYHGLISGASQ